MENTDCSSYALYCSLYVFVAVLAFSMNSFDGSQTGFLVCVFTTIKNDNVPFNFKELLLGYIYLLCDCLCHTLTH